MKILCLENFPIYGMLILENLSKHIFEISDKPQNFTFPKISHSMAYKIMYMRTYIAAYVKIKKITIYIRMYIATSMYVHMYVCTCNCVIACIYTTR